MIYYLARAAIKYHSLGGLNKRNVFSHSLEARSPRSRCQHGQFLMRVPFLFHRWLPSLCVLTCEGERASSPVSLIRRLILKDWGPTFMTSFNLNQIVKNLPAIQETQVQSLGWEDSLRKKTAIHSSPLA